MNDSVARKRMNKIIITDEKNLEEAYKRGYKAGYYHACLKHDLTGAPVSYDAIERFFKENEID